ncbi:hypothetical protein BDW02DRAFT_157073 [Decorospora gaudefroyi]|uniref:RING-type domain-containing protein n=1 Tax=Decorospora gaudefroyi TaxID=184978 RepID=A0A6A5KG49_9PLEO|nr:hypothetical protein BDW02DRAFT_157073 [Decorospora gaudefroyi]
MLLARVPWQLICLCFASIATANISPSNSSTERPYLSHGPLPLNRAESDRGRITDLIPLTKQAASTVQGPLYKTDFDNVANLSTGDIAYISCNPDDYAGYDSAQTVFELAYSQANISAAILYSTATDYCNYSAGNAQDMFHKFPLYSMTDKEDSATVLHAIDNLPVSKRYEVRVQGDDNDGNMGPNTNNANVNQPQNPLGPSPSTAVAMIILYSITGIITALFVVIIVTGAVRAHRHPERYGPRNVLGRPRQSRARGLGRAILDTIPIVKFGEKEPAKPTDVELASTVEVREVDGANVDSQVHTDPATAGVQHTDATAKITATATETPQTGARADEHQSGIAPAQSLATGVATAPDGVLPDENLGCSICTEDFEQGQDLRVLPCDHKFHPECVDPWLLNVSGTCPLCRVDLRPVTSHDSSASHDPDQLAPPLNPGTETSHRRRTAFRDILSLRQRPNASAEERIIALRRLREQRRNQSGDVAAGSANASTEDVANSRDRRARRISARLSDVFAGRSRRERRDESPSQQAEPSISDPQFLPPRNGSTGLDAGGGYSRPHD